MLTNKYFKIFFINLSIFLIILFFLEFFFQVNSNYHFLTQKNRSPPQSIRSLTADEIYQKYNFNILSIPPKYQSHFDPELYKFKYNDINQATALPYKSIPSKNYTTNSIKLSLNPPNNHLALYDVEYKINKYGFRVVEYPSKTKPKKFILALGDSFTFGEGVTTGKDYPSQLASKLNKNWKIYNFGMRGASTNDLIYKIQTNPNFLNEVKEKQGVAIWYFIEEHYKRFFCNLNCYQDGSFDHYISSKPEYTYEKSDFKYIGNFYENAGLYRKTLRILSKSELLKFLNFNFINQPSKYEIQIMAKSLNLILYELKKKLNLDKFYIVFFNNFKSRKLLTLEINKNSELSIIDLTDIPTWMVSHGLIPIDGHPSSEMYYVLTEALKFKLNELPNR